MARGRTPRIEIERHGFRLMNQGVPRKEAVRIALAAAGVTRDDARASRESSTDSTNPTLSPTLTSPNPSTAALSDVRPNATQAEHDAIHQEMLDNFAANIARRRTAR